MMEKETEKKRNNIPKELRKLLIDVDITFFDWCKKYDFTRETARNVAAGIISGNKGLSIKIMEKLKEDFPEVYCIENVGTESEQKARHIRIACS